MVSLSCATFVVYQGYKCWTKYETVPKTTHVSIEKSKLYPDVTFCPTFDFYSRRQNECNISATEYFYYIPWQGNSDPCKDPIKVHEQIVGTIKNLIQFMLISGDDIHDENVIVVDLGNSSNFKPLDHLKGRCYTLQWPKTIDMTWLEIDFASQTSVSIHAPGEFFSSEKATFKLFPRTDTTINVLYETFTVLNFDGEQCHTDEQYNRDDCLYSAIQEESIKDIGCTTPYNPDKSNICSKRDQASEAIGVFEVITIWNQTKANILCPKPCQQYIISLSNKEWNYNR